MSSFDHFFKGQLAARAVRYQARLAADGLPAVAMPRLMKHSPMKVDSAVWRIGNWPGGEGVGSRAMS